MKGPHLRFLLVILILPLAWRAKGESNDDITPTTDSPTDYEDPPKQLDLTPPPPPPPKRLSSRGFVNTSVPFSVAPQPVPDTHEVAEAKKHFMSTYERIKEAIISHDSDSHDFHAIHDEVKNSIDTSTSSSPKPSKASERLLGPLFLPEEEISLFPDPDLEPEYFLPSVHVDPILMNQLDVSFQHHPFIQDFRPIGRSANGGTCYEIVMLEPEEEVMSNVNLAGTAGQRSLLESLINPIQEKTRTAPGVVTTAPHQIIPVGKPAFVGNETGVLRVTKTGRPHALQADDIPDTAKAVSSAVSSAIRATSSQRGSVPSHFQVPPLSFLARFTSRPTLTTHFGR